MPEHWVVSKFSYVINAIGDIDHYMPNSVDSGVPYIMTGDLKDLVSDIDFKSCKQVSFGAYKKLSMKIKTAKGDIILARYATIGTIAYVDIDADFLVSYSCVTIKPNPNKTSGRYLFYYLKSLAFLQAIQMYINSNTQGNVGTDNLRAVKIILPPMFEQTTIAAFLDHETAKLDNLINQQKKLIELLKEKRQAVISHAVTKGLNPNAPMKDSGVEWLGKVPEGWGVLTAKRISKIFVPQRNKPQLNTTADGISWVTMEDMKTSEIITTNLWVTEEEAKIAGSKILPKGAVISSCVGNFGVASINMIDVIINQQLQAFIPSHNINPIFLLHCIRCAKSYFEKIGTAATLIYVNQQGFENMPLAVPPQNEQELIVAFLDQETTKIDTLITKAESAIQLLQERRTALISAAVTGKIDVRGFVKT
ncbi:restriction endonuclease subunit S [Candidatus Nomurabacteria bacterium]|nr:restriction endonuclease subunit S [Candidatus Nomurabacteria bacterium]